jgi:GNAT superfamily N-acetyltransferase
MQLPSSELAASIREALPADAERIAALAGQLGYDVPLEHVERMLERSQPDRAIFVAVVPRAGVVGWAMVTHDETLISSRRAEVHGLVVEDEFRGQRIGELLMQAAEDWGRKRNCSALRLLSNVTRERAHGFYARLGYDILKTEHVFQKNL